MKTHFLRCTKEMGKCLILIVLFIFSKLCNAQKKFIQNDSFKTWDQLYNYAISNDGKFIWYTHGAESLGVSVVITAIDGSFSAIGENVIGSAKFTANSKYALFISNDTLNIFNLDSRSKDVVPNVSGFSIPQGGNSNWLSYQSGNNMYMLDLLSKELKIYKKKRLAIFNSQGTVALVRGDSALDWVDLHSLSEKRIHRNSSIENIVFNNSGNEIVFCPVIDGIKCLFYYKNGEQYSEELVSPGKGLLTNQKISFRDPRFTKDSKRVYFGLIVEPQAPIMPVGNSPVDDPITKKLYIWHYKDEYMQSTMLQRAKNTQVEVVATIGLQEGQIVLIEKPDSTIVANGSYPGSNFAVTCTTGNDTEQNWNDKYMKKYQLVSTKDGSVVNILNDAPVYTTAPKLSSSEQFISWYDSNKGGYFTYEIAKGLIRNVTPEIGKLFKVDEEGRSADMAGGTYGSCWLADDKGLLVYDKYDIWQIDPYGKKNPINITGGIGRQKKIVFRITESEFLSSSLKLGDTMLLAMFDTNTKKNGLYRAVVGKTNKINVDNMIDGFYYFPWMFINNAPKEPMKAQYSNVYVLQHMSCLSAPNICITNDFKKFKNLTNIQPQEQYNWMTVELVKWTKKNGMELHGLLYKPQNFDSTRKYPIIFHYYDRSSHQLHLFRSPELSPGALTIPWYVSNEYLVFVPDTYTLPGNPTKGVVDAVESAVDKLGEFSWIDRTKMGLEGHSFGGYETYALVTNTDYFAAAQASCGISNFISGYSSLGGRAGYLFEAGQTNMRAVPWEKELLYKENSPLSKVANVRTPLLIMHNKDDDAVDFNQALEMFVALRRQRKPVWILEYEGEGHNISDPLNVLDFTIRQQQFFSHYLKGTVAPYWINNPIPARLKDVYSGLTIDSGK